MRRDLARALGGGAGGRVDDVSGGGAPLARRIDAKPPVAAVARVIRDFVSTINTGDTVSLRRFIVEHFAHGPGVPTADERVTRIKGLHGNLGLLKVVRMDELEGGRVDVVVQTEREGEALLIIDTDNAIPARIRRLGVQVGGSDG